MARRFVKLIFCVCVIFFNLQKLREIDQNFFIVPVGTNTFDLHDPRCIPSRYTPNSNAKEQDKAHTSPYIKQALATAIRYIMQIVPTAKFTTFLSTGQRSHMNCHYSFQETHENTIQQNA